MGNKQKNTVPAQFYQTSHPQFSSARINKSNSRLILKIFPGVSFSNWRWNLSPLQPYYKHLLIPTSFTDSQLYKNQQSNWCNSNLNVIPDQQTILAEYQPYIYTLENQIFTRKQNNQIFTNQQIWKILKSIVLAINDWSKAYPDIILSTICPQNIVFNQQGLIKLVHKFSFLQQWPNNNPQYLPSDSYIAVQNGISHRRVSYQSKFTIPIYSLGMVLLDTISQAQIGYSSMSVQQKKNILINSNLYPSQLKNVIFGMVEPSSQTRITLNQLIQSLTKYKEIQRT